MIILQWLDKQTVAEVINNQKNELNEVFRNTDGYKS